jgi:hypothetical protein
MPVSINGSGAITYNDGSVQSTAGYVPFRNRMINGDCRIDQRNNGAVFNSLNGYSLDRWFVDNNTNTVGLTTQRSSVAPSGFINSLAHTVTGTGASPAAGNRNRFGQRIEGFNVADLGWGTASAQPITLSFWVRSSLTGTFSGGFSNNAVNRSYVFTYAVSAANTWEYKTITIAGDTSGTWLTDNSVGININFDIGSGSNFVTTAGAWGAGDFFKSSGSVSFIANSGATFQITGVQLEKGSVATPFEVRPIGTELALCQRYMYSLTPGTNATSNFGTGANSATVRLIYQHPVTMRASPSFTVSGSLSNILLSDVVTGFSVTGFSLVGSTNNFTALNFGSSGITQFRPYVLEWNTTGTSLQFSSEL